jgi:N-acetylglucosaminyldiphosphoundecaprenol N-acetyl-beta-D-mannosaminyltransferase
MNKKVNVLDIEIDNYTAKEAMQSVVEYMDQVPLRVIEVATIGGLMQADAVEELKPGIQEFDIILAGDKSILEAAGVQDKRCLQEIEKNVFLKLFFQYLHKNYKRVYLLVETEEEAQSYYNYFQKHHSGVQIVGLAKVSAADRADDMLVNAINGEEVDCVIAALSTPLQEDFIIKNRKLLDARIWLGIGKLTLPYRDDDWFLQRIGSYIMKHIFKKELEKRKKSEEN